MFLSSGDKTLNPEVASWKQDHIFEGLLGGLPYAVAVRAHNLEAMVRRAWLF